VVGKEETGEPREGPISPSHGDHSRRGGGKRRRRLLAPGNPIEASHPEENSEPPYITLWLDQVTHLFSPSILSPEGGFSLSNPFLRSNSSQSLVPLRW
jgi:hypothetical protein